MHDHRVSRELSRVFAATHPSGAQPLSEIRSSNPLALTTTVVLSPTSTNSAIVGVATGWDTPGSDEAVGAVEIGLGVADSGAAEGGREVGIGVADSSVAVGITDVGTGVTDPSVGVGAVESGEVDTSKRVSEGIGNTLSIRA